MACIADTRKSSALFSGPIAALTFEPHPLWIIAPERAPYRLTPAAKKATLLRRQGVREVVVVRFDEALRQQTAASFVKHLHRTFPNLQEVAIGEGWTFGLNREGTAARLAELGQAFHFQVRAVPPVLLEGSPISSTRIREAFWERRFAEADAMLGWPYAVSGKVIHGFGRGRQIGFSHGEPDRPGTVASAARRLCGAGLSAHGREELSCGHELWAAPHF